MTDTQIMARLEKLERSNKRLKLGLVACGLAVVSAVFVGAAATPQVVTAEAFKLVDSEGKLRAALGSDKDGTFLFLNDPNGKMRASMAAQNVGSYMNLKDEQDRTRVVMSYDEEGPLVRLRDGNSAAVLVWDKEGPLLHLQREDGKSRFLTPTTDAVTEPQPPPADEKK